MVLAGPHSLADEEGTAALAARLAPRLAPGDTILLSGPVGAGKSAFARALIRARLGQAGVEVPSPTFTLVQTYGEGADAIWHADLYRLAQPAEAAELGLLSAMADAICLVEWPDRLGSLAPPGALRLELAPAPPGPAGDVASADARTVTLSGGPGWAGRLRGILG